MKILKFTAPWCGACGPLGVTLKNVLAEFPEAGIVVQEINIDVDPDLAVEHHVTGLPTLIIGDLRLTGSISHAQLRSHIKQALELQEGA